MLDRNRKANRWEDSASLARFVPSELAVPWLPVADEVSFALGRLHRTDAAVELRAAAYAIEPCHRRASALAYLYYDALMIAAAAPMRRGRDAGRDRGRRAARLAQSGPPARDREADRRAFLRWLRQALVHRPGSVKDLYRLGMFEPESRASTTPRRCARSGRRCRPTGRCLPRTRRASTTCDRHT